MTVRIFSGDTDAGYQEWMQHAVQNEGMTVSEAFAAWRKAYWLEQNPGKRWKERRRGVKGSRNHYRDASNLTPFLAQE